MVRNPKLRLFYLIIMVRKWLVVNYIWLTVS